MFVYLSSIKYISFMLELWLLFEHYIIMLITQMLLQNHMFLNIFIIIMA